MIKVESTISLYEISGSENSHSSFVMVGAIADPIRSYPIRSPLQFVPSALQSSAEVNRSNYAYIIAR